MAFEFNGSQHYVRSKRFGEEEVAAQRKRDGTKRRICKENGIDLVVVTAKDLSFAGIRRKIGKLLPLRVLRGFKQTVRYLNACGLGYRRAAPIG